MNLQDFTPKHPDSKINVFSNGVRDLPQIEDGLNGEKVSPRFEMATSINMKNLETIAWHEIFEDLNSSGYSLIKNVLVKPECENLISSYDHNELFRKTINMARYRFGSGEYKYFSYPPPINNSDLKGAALFIPGTNCQPVDEGS